MFVTFSHPPVYTGRVIILNSDKMMKLGLKYMGLLANERDKELGAFYDRFLNEPERLRERINGLSLDNIEPLLSRVLTNVLTRHL